MASDSDDDDRTMMETLVVLTANSVRNMQNHRTMAEWALLLTIMLDDDGDGSDGPRMKRCRTVNPRPDYSASAWGTMLRDSRLKGPTFRQSKLFRRRFRMPYVCFLELVKLVNVQRWFPTREVDMAGRRCIPVELKVRNVSEAKLGRKVGRVGPRYAVSLPTCPIL